MEDGFTRKKVQKVVSKTGAQTTIVANSIQKTLFYRSTEFAKEPIHPSCEIKVLLR